MTFPEELSHHVRVQDYLNDKFQTLADLDSLDNLLESVHTQQQQLRSQLTFAATTLDTTHRSLSAHSVHLQQTSHAFKTKQINIDHRLEAVSSPSAEDSTSALTITIDKLQRLDVATSYISLLQTAHELSEEARVHIAANDPKLALGPYRKLQGLAKSLRARDSAQDGVAVHLVAYVERSTEGLWNEMKGKFMGTFEAVLNKIGWPKEDAALEEHRSEFIDAFEKLIVLQTAELGQGEKQLLPFEALVKPLAMRFRYHFAGERPTNRVDKPEWFLAHLSGLITAYEVFLTEQVQPVLSSVEGMETRDAVVEFITALLPVLRRKTRGLLPQIVGEAPLLSHFIHEMIKFDAELRECFYYAPSGCQGAWKGMTHEVLVVQNVFTGWLQVEKEFALSRYQTILSTDDAWQLDYDSVDLTDSAPTKSALRLKDLLETVTDIYRPLISFSQRLRFLIGIQISLLDQYHSHLHSNLEAFTLHSSTLARALQGTTAAEATISGLGGLERLCRVYGSAVFIESCMRDWGEDVFFLELWEDLQTRAAKHPKGSLVGDMSMQDVANVTSATVVLGDSDGALFDETAASYGALRKRTEEMIAELLINTLKADLKPYSKIALWDASADSSILTISPEMLTPATTLRTHLAFLHRAISVAAYRRILRALSTALTAFFLDSIILRNQFSLDGGQQLQKDVLELWRDEQLPKRLEDVLRLLTMETETLRGTVRVVFEDNEKARGLLEVLGIGLSVGEVRGVMQRRVDAWGVKES